VNTGAEGLDLRSRRSGVELDEVVMTPPAVSRPRDRGGHI
jgi:hypothetical protein